MIVILVLVAVACAPAMAAVTICSEKSGTTVTVKYQVTGPNSVRAFALDASVSTGTISNVTCSNASYYVYPGSIQILSGSIANSGDCVCSSAYPGTNPGETTSAVTVEMGSLYAGTSKPASSGTLFTMTISNSAATVTFAANTVRGGVVMENPAESPGLTFSNGALCGCFAACGECFPTTYTSYNDWKTAGKPDCWCGTNTAGMIGTAPWKFQCYGDADNKTQVTGVNYRVYTNDYAKIASNWKKKITDPTLDACADIDHKAQVTGVNYRVYTNDYAKVASNWKKKDSQFPGSGNCPQGI